MTIKSVSEIKVSGLPKIIPPALQQHWKIVAGAAACIALPAITQIYFRWGRPLSDPTRHRSIPFNPLVLFMRRSLEGVDAVQLGFSESLLNRKFSRVMPGSTDQAREFEFIVVCNQLLDALRSEIQNQNNPITINALHSGHILEAWPCGLAGQSYEALADKSYSWLHRILQALAEDKYISSFEMHEHEGKKEIHIKV
ncbi:MAG: hypothetical protein JSS10_02020 [Verrucomicrobia bacterium]|nr:hypothetical protein [Verrucomicrobiota bacterium]